MRLLLDTHALVWHFEGNPLLSEDMRINIETPRAECFVSIGSLWELAIKVRLGGVNVSVPFPDGVMEQMHRWRIHLLPIEPYHLTLLLTLPLHHRDPFDRLLVAQAMVEQLTIMSKDKILDSYGVRRIW